MATLTASPTAAGHYAAAIERAERDRLHEPAWLRGARRSAAEAFGRMGVPTVRDEEWRATNVAPIADTPFVPAPPASVPAEEAARFLVPGLAGPRLVFVNGRYAAGLSAPGFRSAGVAVSTIADAIEHAPEPLESCLTRHRDYAGHPFAALNTALFDDGALVTVADNTVADEPIQLVFLSTVTSAPAMSAPRVLVRLGRNSHATLIETFGSLGPASGFTNAVTDVVVGEGSVLDHCRVQRESESAFHVGRTEFRLGRSSRSSSHAVALGGRIARHDALAVLGDEGASCTLNGLYLAGGRQLIDNHTEIDHARPHGTSHELYKGILGGRARGVFNGRIRVRPDAQKTDAKQTNKALLLSDEAQINSKPQLEIFANDVRCTHGATIGQLSQDALFYLRTRGIGLDDARSLLVTAFAADVTSRVGLEPLRAELDRLLAARLPGLLAGEVRR